MRFTREKTAGPLNKARELPGCTRRRQFPVPVLPSLATGTKRAHRFHKSTVRLATPSDAERAALELAPDAKVIHIDRVRMLNDFPVINERVALPTARFPHFNFEFDKVPNTLYEHYQIHFGITVAHATEQIEVTMPDSGDLKRLNIERNHPLLLVTRTSFDLQDRPVEFRISRINTGNHVYRADLR